MEIGVIIGIAGFVLVFALLAVGVHIMVAMGVIGFLGVWYLLSLEQGRALLETVPFTSTANFLLVAVPLFILMGYLAGSGGITAALYDGIAAWIGKFRAGVGISTIVGCAFFAAISGSSYATAATFGTISIPEMRRLGYSPRLAAGCVAAGGTLGIMIPPSILLVIYGWICGVSIAKLFMAGIIPGIISAIVFSVVLLMQPTSAVGTPARSSATLWVKIRGLGGIAPLVGVFVLMMGGIYGGIFTPTEAAAVGALAILTIGFAKRKLSISAVGKCLEQSALTSAMIFAIIVGCCMFATFVALSQLPVAASQLVASLEVNRWAIMVIIVAILFVLGMFLETVSIMLLTLPIMFPVVIELGFDPVWFGIIVCKCAQIGLITPPLGMNAYIIAGVAKDIPLLDIFKGIMPFLCGDIVTLCILLALPQITLFLPSLMTV